MIAAVEVIMRRSKGKRAARWTVAEARQVLDEFAQSGLSVNRFAAEHELGVERLYRWQRRLKGSRRVVASAPRFAEVTLRPAPPASLAIEIELPGGVSVRVAGATRVDDTVAILSRLPAR